MVSESVIERVAAFLDPNQGYTARAIASQLALPLAAVTSALEHLKAEGRAVEVKRRERRSLWLRHKFATHDPKVVVDKLGLFGAEGC
ncbi:MAG: hypothetical protein KKA90_00180 [Nanoarchaeota archaeon]|nr:hypothetical protein [Nanoarchaeota archaeon]